MKNLSFLIASLLLFPLYIKAQTRENFKNNLKEYILEYKSNLPYNNKGLIIDNISYVSDVVFVNFVIDENSDFNEELIRKCKDDKATLFEISAGFCEGAFKKSYKDVILTNSTIKIIYSFTKYDDVLIQKITTEQLKKIFGVEKLSNSEILLKVLVDELNEEYKMKKGDDSDIFKILFDRPYLIYCFECDAKTIKEIKSDRKKFLKSVSESILNNKSDKNRKFLTLLESAQYGICFRYFNKDSAESIDLSITPEKIKKSVKN